MSLKSKYAAPDFLNDLLVYSELTLKKNGVDDSQAKKIAKEIAQQMCDQWGGQQVYFPFWIKIERQERDYKIYKEFKGDNHQELARKYKLSVQAIYRIINDIKSDEMEKRQSKLAL